MKILKDEGASVILSKTEDIIGQIASAARTCYKSEDKSSPESDTKLVKNLLTRGHEAMIEFADMTVKFTNVSRGFTHEMVRHRLVSFAQESTRYVDESKFEVVVPPHKDEVEHLINVSLPKNTMDGILEDASCHCIVKGLGMNESIDYNKQSLEMYINKQKLSLTEWLEMNEQAYRALRAAGWKPEDARQVLPTAIKADIVVKANMREWRHIFEMRCSKYAHWEIRAVMIGLLRVCKTCIPLLFDDFHFFDNEKYARKIMTGRQLKEEIMHFYLSGGKSEELAQDAATQV